MIEAIGSFLGRIAIYVTALLGLIALYFLWVAFREWRASRRAMFGVERDIAASEMMGAIARAGVLVVIGLLVVGLGWLGRQSASDGETAQATRPPLQTTPGATAATPGSTLPSTDTPQPVVTDVPPLPEVTTPPPAVEPTPQTAIVNAFGGVWLRDAPNGGTIVVVSQNSVVELLEGRQAAGDFEWQKVRILSVPPGSGAQPGQEGWVASEYLEVGP
jgi:hypothetical protein